MSKYKININKKPPTNEEINRGKDFNKLIDTYADIHKPQKVIGTIHRNRKMIRLSIILIVILMAFLFSQNYFSEEPSIEIEKTNSIEHQTSDDP